MAPHCGPDAFSEGSTNHEQQRKQISEREQLEENTPTTAAPLLRLQGHHQLFDKTPITPRLRWHRRLPAAKQATPGALGFCLNGLVAPLRLLIRIPLAHSYSLPATSYC